MADQTFAQKTSAVRAAKREAVKHSYITGVDAEQLADKRWIMVFNVNIPAAEVHRYFHDNGKVVSSVAAVEQSDDDPQEGKASDELPVDDAAHATTEGPTANDAAPITATETSTAVVTTEQPAPEQVLAAPGRVAERFVSKSAAMDYARRANKARADKGYKHLGFDVIETKEGFYVEFLAPEATQPAPRTVTKESGDRDASNFGKGVCDMIWATADALHKEGKTRSEIVAACVAKGAALGTARTQYQHWKKARGL